MEKKSMATDIDVDRASVHLEALLSLGVGSSWALLHLSCAIVFREQ